MSYKVRHAQQKCKHHDAESLTAEFWLYFAGKQPGIFHHRHY